jgi:citronellol/citronellal dehydrogenase
MKGIDPERAAFPPSVGKTPMTLAHRGAGDQALRPDAVDQHPRHVRGQPGLYSDAAYAVITRPSRDRTGNAFLCEDVLAAEGVTDFDRYAYQPGTEPAADLFVDHA